MIKLIIGVEGTNILCRRIPNNVGGYSPLQEVKLTLILQCGLE